MDNGTSLDMTIQVSNLLLFSTVICPPRKFWHPKNTLFISLCSVRAWINCSIGYIPVHAEPILPIPAYSFSCSFSAFLAMVILSAMVFLMKETSCSPLSGYLLNQSVKHWSIQAVGHGNGVLFCPNTSQLSWFLSSAVLGLVLLTFTAALQGRSFGL